MDCCRRGSNSRHQLCIFKASAICDQLFYLAAVTDCTKNRLGSFIVDALNVEDDSPLADDRSILEWAEKEAANLGLLGLSQK